MREALISNLVQEYIRLDGHKLNTQPQRDHENKLRILNRNEFIEYGNRTVLYDRAQVEKQR